MIITLCVLFSLCTYCLIDWNLLSLPDNLYTNYEELEGVNFGRIVNAELNQEIRTGSKTEKKGEVVIKLFGFIPIKKISVNILPEEEVYVGGQQVGLSINTEGVIVSSVSVVDNDEVCIKKNKYFRNGDIIQGVNNESVFNLDDLKVRVAEIFQSGLDHVEFEVKRNGKREIINYPIIKNSEGNYKLGFWGRDNYSGIGTLSFVLSENNKFGALGHSVSEENNGQIIPMISGELYSCDLINIEKGKINHPGQLNCFFTERDPKGTIEHNTQVGIFGRLNSAEGMVDVNKRAKLGGRLSVKMGKASIISCVSGISQEYDIEIVKVNHQATANDKSFVFRVIDDDLIDLTGGIVQGMSGSPIMQNGKIIGAVTHVFVSDATMGYGVYTDWMLENLL